MAEVRLREKYVRDIEWWLAYPADPRFTYHDPGEVLTVDDDEAKMLLEEGIAELTGEED